MISFKDFYSVLTAVVPLYVAMFVAYGSVRWWKLLTPDQCSGINRFVAIFAVPLLSFQIISHNNPYKMNLKFVAADALQKFIVLVILGLWARFSSKGSIEWVITLFMLATLPNTLVMGIPLEISMYGSMPSASSLVVQAVVLQCIIWYTLLLFLYEYRSAKLVLKQQQRFESSNNNTINNSNNNNSRKSSVVCTEASVDEDGRISVHVRRQITHQISSSSSSSLQKSSEESTQLSNMEVYSTESSRSHTPINDSDMECFRTRHTVRTPTIVEEEQNDDDDEDGIPESRCLRMDYSDHEHVKDLLCNQAFSHRPTQLIKKGNNHNRNINNNKDEVDCEKELQMFIWSADTSPSSSADLSIVTAAAGESHRSCSPWQHNKMDKKNRKKKKKRKKSDNCSQASFSTNCNAEKIENGNEDDIEKCVSNGNNSNINGKDISEKNEEGKKEETKKEEKEQDEKKALSKLILWMVWSKLIRNPNTYSSLLGLLWSLVAFRWNITMPKIAEHSITILSDAGLGMAMFSLGLFMALQSRFLACGTWMTMIGMVIRFVTGPAIMSATSIAVGLRNFELRASIIQAALPQGIVPFVFAKEYNVHPEVLSTAVIFGMLVSLPITLIYYLLLGL